MAPVSPFSSLLSSSLLLHSGPKSVVFYSSLILRGLWQPPRRRCVKQLPCGATTVTATARSSSVESSHFQGNLYKLQFKRSSTICHAAYKSCEVMVSARTRNVHRSTAVTAWCLNSTCLFAASYKLFALQFHCALLPPPSLPPSLPRSIQR